MNLIFTPDLAGRSRETYIVLDEFLAGLGFAWFHESGQVSKWVGGRLGPCCADLTCWGGRKDGTSVVDGLGVHG
jgi:hypothetical protein